MGLYQSFKQVFVTNSPALLAEGQTVDALAVGQIGLLDAKTYKAVTAPTYAKNKAIYAVWGTPDLNLGDFGGAPNENEYSKLIKGKMIARFRAKRAKRGQTPLYTIGWSGDVSDNDSLFAKPGESKSLFIKLTGTIIDRLYGKQGIVKEFITEPECVDNCADACGDIKCPILVEQLVSQINSDKDFKKFIRAKSLVTCSGVTPPSTTTCYKFSLSVCDTGDDTALGLVQAQYPADIVERVGRTGAISKYTVIRNANTTPTAFSQTGVFIAECPSCPATHTLIPEAKVFQVKTPNGVNVAAVQGVFTGETSVTLVNTDPQFLTYMVTFPVSTTEASVLADATTAGYVSTFIGVQSAICQQTTPSTTTWVADGTLVKQEKAFRITLADSVCGTDRLADLQAAFPNLVVSVVDAGGSCVHTYETTVESACYEAGCAVDEIKFIAPAIFEGAQWVEVPAEAIPENSVCKCGIQLETAFFNIKTNECTFDSFPYENDIVHIQASNYNPDFNADPCEGQWVVKQIRQVQFPQGHGQYVQHLEKESKQYDQRFRSWDPVVREVQGYSLQADPNKFYDEYVLEFGHRWKTSGGWAEVYEDSYHLSFFVPEGTGNSIETALNSYVTSAGIEEDGAAI